MSVSKGGKDAKDSAVKDGSLFVIIFLITSVALLILVSNIFIALVISLKQAIYTNNLPL